MTMSAGLRVFMRLVLALAVAALALTALAAYWLGTQSGLEWIAHRAMLASEGRLSRTGVQGSIYRRITVARAEFDDPAAKLDIQNLQLEWQPRALLRRKLQISKFGIGALAIAYAASDETVPPPFPATLRLPIDLAIAEGEVRRILLNGEDAAADLRFRLRSDSRSHELELVNVTLFGARASGALSAGTAQPFALAGSLALAGTVRKTALSAKVQIDGSLERPRLKLATAALGGLVTADVLLRPFSVLPLETLQLDAQGIDLALWEASLPRTRVSLKLAATMPRRNRYAGAFTALNGLPGLLDAKRIPLTRAAASFSGSGTDWELSNIALDIGKAGRITGTGAISRASTRLVLRVANLRTDELHGKLRSLTVAGNATLTGDADTQRLLAKLAGNGTQLDIAANHARDILTVETGTLRAKDARLDFSARLALSPERTFALNAAFANLDPARFIHMPSALLNGTLATRGRLAPSWLADVRLALTNSRFH
ncbi:MAG: hypothetical protein FJY56_12555 [Betaproteobacteria bacterium]|nr:hypothetical protein [Betaproteobacteria bacterium]